MKKIISILFCPVCKKRLKQREKGYYCSGCRIEFTSQNQIPIFLKEEKLDSRKKRELAAFNDLKAYQELMKRPYFQDLKAKIKRALKSYQFQNKTILEIGAGTSEFLDLFAKNNLVVASDLNLKLLKQNQERVQLVVADAEYLPFADQSFDFVYLIGVLHHLGNQKKALKEIKRVLKIDGRVFMSEPTQWSLNLPYYLIRQLLMKVLGEKRLRELSGCVTPDESFVFLRNVKEVFGSDFQLKLTKVLPLRLPPLKFFERFSVNQINSFLEKIPVLNNLGTIVFIEAKRRRKQK